MSALSLADVVQKHREALAKAVARELVAGTHITVETVERKANSILDVILAELDRLADQNGPMADWENATTVHGGRPLSQMSLAQMTDGERRHVAESGGAEPTAHDRRRISEYDQVGEAIRDYFGGDGSTPWLAIYGDAELSPVRVLASPMGVLAERGMLAIASGVVARDGVER